MPKTIQDIGIGHDSEMTRTDVQLLSSCNEILGAQQLFHFVIISSEHSDCLAWLLLLHRLLFKLDTICRRNTSLGPSCTFSFIVPKAVPVVQVQGSSGIPLCTNTSRESHCPCTFVSASYDY